MPPHASESPAKKQSKWSAEEDALIIELRGNGMKWDDISKRLPGRSAISCRLHYQNYLERRSEWDEERKNKLARLYERFKPEMWAKVAEEMAIPWRAAEAMHWHLGEQEMARRAGVVPFSLTAQNLDSSPHQGSGHHRGSPRGHHGGHAHSHSQGSVTREIIGSGARWTRGGGLAGDRGIPPPPPIPTPAPPPLPRPPYPMTRRESSTGVPHHHHHHQLSPVTHNPVEQQQQHLVESYHPGAGASYHHPHAHPHPHAHHSPRHHHQALSGPPLAPIQMSSPRQQPLQQQLLQNNGRGGPGSGGMLLPGVAELTTGVSPYSTPAYSMGGVMSGSPAAVSPGPYGPPLHGPPTAPPSLGGGGGGIGGGSTKRRRSSPSSASPEASRRRQYLEPRPP